MTPAAALEITQLTKQYDRHPVLRGVNLRAESGRFIALLGPSGCGKTTTLRLVAGFELPDSGSISIDGRTMADSRTAVPPEDRRVGMVFQEYALFPHLNVGDNIAFGLKGAQKHVRVDEMLALVGLEGLGKRMPDELSGGQQQRVALARALAPQPRLILLDEPFSNLDSALRAQVRSEVSRILRAANVTCLLVTHDQEEALSLADEVAVMFDGQIAQIAAPQTLYRAPATKQVAAFVGEANFLPAEAKGRLAVCALGTLLLDEAAAGGVEVLVRPEQVQLAEDGEITARVVWREYYGHDQRVGLALADGTELVARVEAGVSCTVGQSVWLTVRGTARAFAV
jgi:iron(III) transport system ATP-binding protein